MKHKETEITPSARERKIKRVERSVLSVLLALVLGAVMFIAGWFGRWGALGENKQNLLWAIDTAGKYYYRDTEDSLYDNLFASFEFDPYSTYYTAEEYEVIAAEREGQNRDAGFSVYGQESRLEVYAVIAGSSAESAGITSGMYFLKFGKTAETLQTGTAEDYFAFVATLAPNEKYLVQCGESESEAAVYEVENDGNGAGIALNRKYDPMRVYRVVGNSSAARAGLKRGMYILKFGASENPDEMISGSSADLSAFVRSLKPDEKGNYQFYMQCGFDKAGADAKVYPVGMEEYQATYCTYRDSEKSYSFRPVKKDGATTIERVPTEEPLTALDDSTAYIALTEFTGNAAREFKECLDLMKEKGRTNLIIDLRGNGGGYMDVFVEIASYLLKDAGAGAQKVAYAKFKSGATVSYSASRSNYSTYFTAESRVSVLADEYTASASECLIGALVDYKTIAFSDIYLHENENGVAKTYGKGIMQTHYENSTGATLKLTSAEIFWPKSNKTIHDVGVTAKGDGAIAIKSSLLPDQNDGFLQEAIGLIKEKPTTSPDAPTTSV